MNVPVLFLRFAVNRCKVGVKELTRFSGVPFCKLVTNSSRSETHPEVLKATAMMHARISRIRKEDVWNLFRDLYRSVILIQTVCSRVFKLSSAKLHLANHLSIHPSFHPSIHPSINLFIYLSIHLPIHSAPQIVSEARHIFSDSTRSTFRLFPVQISFLLAPNIFCFFSLFLFYFVHVTIFIYLIYYYCRRELIKYL